MFPPGPPSLQGCLHYPKVVGAPAVWRGGVPGSGVCQPGAAPGALLHPASAGFHPGRSTRPVRPGSGSSSLVPPQPVVTTGPSCACWSVGLLPYMFPGQPVPLTTDPVSSGAVRPDPSDPLWDLGFSHCPSGSQVSSSLLTSRPQPSSCPWLLPSLSLDVLTSFQPLLK